MLTYFKDLTNKILFQTLYRVLFSLLVNSALRLNFRSCTQNNEDFNEFNLASLVLESVPLHIIFGFAMFYKLFLSAIEKAFWKRLNRIAAYLTDSYSQVYSDEFVYWILGFLDCLIVIWICLRTSQWCFHKHDIMLCIHFWIACKGLKMDIIHCEQYLSYCMFQSLRFHVQRVSSTENLFLFTRSCKIVPKTPQEYTTW